MLFLRFRLDDWQWDMNIVSVDRVCRAAAIKPLSLFSLSRGAADVHGLAWMRAAVAAAPFKRLSRTLPPDLAFSAIADPFRFCQINHACCLTEGA